MQTTTTTLAPSDNPKPLDLETPEALSDKLSPSAPTPRQESVEIDMEPVPTQHVERTDTLESLQSNFQSRRTNTIWSMVSTTTDYTEVTEPDHATVHDEGGEEHYASPSRSFTTPCRSDSFQSPPPSRTTSFNIVDDEAMGPTRSTAHPDIRPLTHPDLLRLREMSSPPRNSHPGRHGRSHPHSVPMPIRQKGPEGPSPTPPRSALAREDDGAAAGPSNPAPGHEASATAEGDRAQSMATSSEPRSEAEWTHEDPEDWAVADASQRLDENLIQDVCDRMLKHVFGVELQDLVDTDAAPEAYRSVNYCLDELSRIISASNAASFSPPMNEMPRGGGEQSHTPIQPAGSGSDPNGQGGNGSGSSRRPTNKRGPSDAGDSQDGDDNDGMGGNGGGNKKPKTENSDDQRLSCPFRKRNPVKFNVRDHQNCAVQSFPDVSQLKRHVKIFHKQKAVSPFDCPRCKRNMGAKEALQEHLAVSNDRICTFQETPSSQNPEDGINAKIEDLLNGRRANSKVDTWDILWQTLFPDDHVDAIPDSAFVPPVELDEVHADFHVRSCREDLRTRISEEELSAAAESRQDVDAHVARMVDICEEYIEDVFRTCRQFKIGNLQSQMRRKRVQKPRAARGPSDPARLAIPATTASQVGFAGASDDNPSSASSIDTPRSNASWAFGSQPGMSSTPLAHFPAPMNGYSDLGIVGGGMDVSGANGGVAMTSAEALIPLAFTSQTQPDHSRKASEDSAVSFERTTAFVANHGMHHRHIGFGPQIPYQQNMPLPRVQCFVQNHVPHGTMF